MLLAFMTNIVFAHEGTVAKIMNLDIGWSD
jgi:hypothetical protein